MLLRKAKSFILALERPTTGSQGRPGGGSTFASRNPRGGISEPLEREAATRGTGIRLQEEKRIGRGKLRYLAP